MAESPRQIVMLQRWRELLFAHWRVDSDLLRPLVPSSLDLDLWEGTAWVGLVPFTMDRIRPRWMPSLPGLESLHETNLRTYVRCGDLRGVWFFSLDATSHIAVRSARFFYLLPYHHARISLDTTDGWIEHRTHRTSNPSAFCHARYRGTGDAAAAPAGSLEEFLIERYRFFATRGERVWTAQVFHEPYQVERAEAAVKEGLTEAAGLPFTEPPELLHYSRGVSVQIGRLRRLRPER